jgi:hypothetical protein
MGASSSQPHKRRGLSGFLLAGRKKGNGEEEKGNDDVGREDVLAGLPVSFLVSFEVCRDVVS